MFCATEGVMKMKLQKPVQLGKEEVLRREKQKLRKRFYWLVSLQT